MESPGSVGAGGVGPTWEWPGAMLLKARGRPEVEEGMGGLEKEALLRFRVAYALGRAWHASMMWKHN